MFRLLLFILIFPVFLRCDYRSRSNPLDPGNETTGGKPTGLTVTSRMDTVNLTWPDLNFENLTAFTIYRADSAQSEPMPLGTVPASIREFQETGLAYEKTYWYRISARSDDFESKLSDPVSIIPGPTYTWVLEQSTGSISKLTHDCRHFVFQTFYSGYPDQLAVNPADGSAWIFDDFLNRIYHVDANGNFQKILDVYNRIPDLEVDPNTSGLWLVDAQNLQVLLLNTNGYVIQRFQNFKRPTCLAVDSQTGNCWVVDSDAGKIFLCKPDGQISRKADFPFLGVSKIVLHEATGTLWLADSLRLLQVEGMQVKQVVAGQVLDLAVDQSDGGCWVAGSNGISKYASNGVRKFTQSGYFYEPSISVNQFNRSCLVSERLTAQLLQISRYGSEVTTLGTVRYPSAVAVEYRTKP